MQDHLGPALTHEGSQVVTEVDMIRVCDARLSPHATLADPFGRGVSLTGATKLYLHPWNGNRIALLDGTDWKLFNVNSPVELTLNTSFVPGTLFDVWAYVSGGAVTLMQAAWKSPRTVTGATNATPIVVTTSANHLYQNGDEVYISGVRGNTAANGVFTVANATATTFELSGTAGNGTYTSGGHANARTVKYERVGGALVDSTNHARRFLGTVLYSGTGTTDLSPTFMGLANYHNRQDYVMEWVDETADVGRNTSAAFARWKGEANPHLTFVLSYPDQAVEVAHSYDIQPTGTNTIAIAGVGYDRTDLNDGDHALVTTTATRGASTNHHVRRPLMVGSHTLNYLQFTNQASATFFTGRLRARLMY